TVIMTAVTATVPDTSTRERLIAAAIEVFAEQGYERARLQDIARTAGLTTGAVYANYRSKAELLFDAIGARAGAELDGLLQGRRAQSDGALDARAVLEPLRGRAAQSDGARAARAVPERLGDRLPAARPESPSLLLDAVAAARRDDDLAAL